MTTKTNIPTLRFSEFTDEWEMKKLGEIADISKLAGYEYTKHVIYQDSGKIIALRALNIKKNALNLNDVKYIDESDFSKLKRSKLFIGDLMFTYIGANIGDVALIDENDRFYLAPNVARIRSNNKLLNYFFILHYFNISTFLKNEISGYIASSSQPALSMESIRKFEIIIPSLPEQTKIANFLTTVDEKLTQLKQKKSLLEQYKKGVMQKIFSQELRFKDENGNKYPDWEEKKLGEVLEIQGGYAFKSNLFNKGNSKVIRIGDITPNIYLNKFKGVVSNEVPDLKYMAKKNDFLMALSGATFGKVGKIQDNEIGYINQRVALFRTNECLEFYYQLVQTDEFKNYINSIPTASAQPNISNSDVISYISLIPSFSEQTKIANFLSAIDNKIQHCGVQIENVELWKKGLLQGMFV